MPAGEPYAEVAAQPQPHLKAPRYAGGSPVRMASWVRSRRPATIWPAPSFPSRGERRARVGRREAHRDLRLEARQVWGEVRLPAGQVGGSWAFRPRAASDLMVLALDLV